MSQVQSAADDRRRPRAEESDAAVTAVAKRTKVALQVVEEFDGEQEAVFIQLPESALRLNVATRDQVRICWQEKPKCCLLVKKLGDSEVTEQLCIMGNWLQKERGIRVMVEPAVASNEAPQFEAIDPEDPGAGVDLIICIGGDGTMLHISSMFRDPGLAIPPLLCFKGGSLGFLTIHDFADHRELIDRVLAAVSSPLPPLMDPISASNPHHRSNSSVTSTGSGRSASWRRHGSMSVRIIGTETVVAPLSATHPQPNSNPFKALPSPTELPTDNNSEVHADSNDVAPFDNSISRTNLALPVAPAHNSSNSPLSTGGSAIVKSTVSAHESASTCTFIKAPPIFVIPRMRLFCRVYRGDAPTVPISIQQPLNELLVDRGSSAFLSSLELWIDGQLVTNVQADGLIVATPSGSSAYSLSAGGPLVAPSVCALLVTPICPHSLSFRPLLLPDCSRIKIRMPDGARASAWASFDGRAGVELRPGDFVEVIMSRNPLPTISFCEFNSEWFDSIVQKLHWNVRTMQKPLKRSPSPKL